LSSSDDEVGGYQARFARSERSERSNQTRTLWLVADQTSASINIAAKPDEIMAVISDFEHYPDWVDSMKSAEVLTSAGGKAKTVRMVLDHTLVKDNYVLAYDWKPRAVNWKLIEGNLLKAMDGSYVLKPNGAGTTVTYTLTVDISMPMIGMFRRKAEKAIIESALKGLKKRVEG
jgi:ribosome-associated toxin RatA of RatAB toxin-antitoxin module